MYRFKEENDEQAVSKSKSEVNIRVDDARAQARVREAAAARHALLFGRNSAQGATPFDVALSIDVAKLIKAQYDEDLFRAPAPPPQPLPLPAPV